MNRKAILEKIKTGAGWDLVVIGGGATGLGTALEAVSRGYQVLLLEQSDFAKSTSSKSTKLVHGGVRYLAQGDVALVREASIERGLLLKNAPHLVRNLSFVIPLYSFWDKFKYTIGLKVYDWIAGRLSLGSSVYIRKKEVVQKLPTVEQKGLTGGVLYHDGQFDDSRLALNLAQTVVEKGGFVLNYARVTGLKKSPEGQVCGVDMTDMETGASYSISAKAVINATGVFVDDVLQMDKPGVRKSTCASQGVHVVLDRSFLPGDHALMIPETPDGRVLFAVPWHDKLVVGTTDTPVESASLEPVALEQEIQFILDTASQYLVRKPSRKDVLSVFAGLRPLAAPQGDGQKTKEISRSHKIIVTSSKLFTIIGGKWTTYRRMGEDMVNKVEETLQLPKTQTGTRHMKIHGYQEGVSWADPLYFYGSDAAAIRDMIAEDGSWISEKLQIRKAQVVWAVQEEMALAVEDVLARRTRALLLDAEEAVRVAPLVADVMAPLLGKDESWKEAQVESFKKIASNYIINNTTPLVRNLSTAI